MKTRRQILWERQRRQRTQRLTSPTCYAKVCEWGAHSRRPWCCVLGQRGINTLTETRSPPPPASSKERKNQKWILYFVSCYLHRGYQFLGAFAGYAQCPVTLC